jgi:hypothetical protein
MSVTLNCTSAPYVITEKLEWIPDGCEFGCKKCKWGYGGACGGIWRSLHLAGVWSQTVGFLLVLVYKDILQILYF